MSKPALKLIVNRTGTDQDFFESKEAFEEYQRQEAELRKEPLKPMFPSLRELWDALLGR